MTAPSAPQPVCPCTRAWPLHGLAPSRRLEQAAMASEAPHALMQRAGLALARLAAALAPASRTVWVAAGPGNNGGDGLVAARWLQQWGRSVQVSLLADPLTLPGDARHAHQQALQAGVPIRPELPLSAHVPADLAIDALLGLGASRAPQGPLAEAIERLNQLPGPLLAVDLPSGLCGGTGALLGTQAVRATHTLALLSLKPGLFTGHGRDQAGQVWFDDLGLPTALLAAHPPDAWLTGPPALRPRRHGQHKGSFGDLVVLGGAPGMGGAALLAARAALAAGAGRVYLCRLDSAQPLADAQQPELMPRSVAQVLQLPLLTKATVVAGCGGGQAIRQPLPVLLRHAARLVLDADALNAVADDDALRRALAARGAGGRPTVITPHPLEAARLLRCSTAQVQADRLLAARSLADEFSATVLLKGSGSLLCAPGQPTWINPTGNARLASAGTGDVLAGWIGGQWSQQPETTGLDAALASAWRHGRAAETDAAALRAGLPLGAGELIKQMGRATAGLCPRSA